MKRDKSIGALSKFPIEFFPAVLTLPGTMGRGFEMAH